MWWIPNWRWRRHLGPATVRMSSEYRGIHDWEVVLGMGGGRAVVISFGAALVRPGGTESPSGRQLENPYSESNYRDAVEFADWVNSPAGPVEKLVRWWKDRFKRKADRKWNARMKRTKNDDKTTGRQTPSAR